MSAPLWKKTDDEIFHQPYYSLFILSLSFSLYLLRPPPSPPSLPLPPTPSLPQGDQWQTPLISLIIPVRIPARIPGNTGVVWNPGLYQYGNALFPDGCCRRAITGPNHQHTDARARTNSRTCTDTHTHTGSAGDVCCVMY